MKIMVIVLVVARVAAQHRCRIPDQLRRLCGERTGAAAKSLTAITDAKTNRRPVAKKTICGSCGRRQCRLPCLFTRRLGTHCARGKRRPFGVKHRPMSETTTPPQDPFGVREGEIATELPTSFDAGRLFHRPHPHAVDAARGLPKECRASPTPSAPSNSIRATRKALDKVETCSHLIVLYWMDRARRDLVVQTPRHYGEGRGTFALRSPVRPNPIALSVVKLVKIDGTTLSIQNIDCLDNTPVLDIKPYFASVDSKASTPPSAGIATKTDFHGEFVTCACARILRATVSIAPPIAPSCAAWASMMRRSPSR